jgi:hypothetical protein
MTRSRIITVINDDGTSKRTGLDADNHLAKLDIKSTEDGTFVEEVKRKLDKSEKEK